VGECTCIIYSVTQTSDYVNPKYQNQGT